MAFVGLTYAEIVSHVAKYIGNQSADFNEYVRQTVLLAEQRYLKMHDWSFLRKTDLSLSITTGTAEYDLAFTVSGKNYTMAANEVETIRFEADNLVLKRVMLDEIRRLDPDNNDGSSNDTPTYWAVAGQNRIRIWPPTTKNGTLKIDGKVVPEQPDYNSFGNEYPSIPVKFQEGFIEYVKAMALDRENDDRALAKKQEALTLILQDIQSDLEVDDRIRSLEEFRYDGIGSLLDIPGFRPWD
jgi:hypothetical protein